MKWPPWTMSKRHHISVEIALSVAAVVSGLGTVFSGLGEAVYGFGPVIGPLICAIIFPLFKHLVRTPEEERLAKHPNFEFLTQEEYDSIEERDESTLYFTRPNKPDK